MNNIISKREGAGSTAAASRKREADAISVTSDVKRPRKEIDFHMHEMEEYLEWALDYAREGNRSSMDYNIAEARRRASQCNQIQGIEARAMEIRKHINSQLQNAYHMKEMKEYLEWALDYAREGNRSSMDYNITEARRQASQSHVNSILISIPFAITALVLLLLLLVSKCP